MRCAEACVVTTQIGIRPEDARRVGFPNVEDGQYYVIGQVSRVRLARGKWKKVFLRVTPAVRDRLRTSKTGVKVAGRLVAASLVSGRHGSAGWVRTCAVGAA